MTTRSPGFLKHVVQTYLLCTVVALVTVTTAWGAGPNLDASLQRISGASEAGLVRAADDALAAGVDPAFLAELMQRAVELDLAASHLEPVVRRAERLHREGLPSSPVLSRYLQGLSKGVPLSRIHGVVSELEERLQLAADQVDAALPLGALPAADRLAAIDHAAYALELGVSPDVLGRTLTLASAETAPGEDLQAPVLTLGLLVASRVDPAQSYEVVSSAWHHGFRGRDLERLGKLVGELGRGGRAPTPELVRQVLAMIGNGNTPDGVFEGLDELMGRTPDGRVPLETRPGETPSTRRGPTDRPTGVPDNIDRDPHRNKFNSGN